MQSRAVMFAYSADAYLWPIIEGFVMLAILAVPVLGIVLLVRAAQRFHPARPLQEQARRHERGQGRVADGETLHALSLPAPVSQGGIAIAHGLPLAYLHGVPLGLPWQGDAGHVAVIGPTRSGKSFHLTDTLLRWPGPAVCIDPKGEQWERTAGFRLLHYGPVYRIPPQGLVGECGTVVTLPIAPRVPLPLSCAFPISLALASAQGVPGNAAVRPCSRRDR
ncbi:MAG: hypothetical protein NVS4B2_35830 [Chloroflexota bacterium]